MMQELNHTDNDQIILAQHIVKICSLCRLGWLIFEEVECIYSKTLLKPEEKKKYYLFYSFSTQM